MKIPTGAAIGGAVASLALLALMASPSFAQVPPAAAGPTSGAGPAHEQMHQTMDEMHGPGTSQRMHAAMGPDADQLMDQFVGMQEMMQRMQNMMDQGSMAGMSEDQRRKMQSMMTSMRQMMPMMQNMMAKMGSASPPTAMAGDHAAMMEQMMRSMMGMMQDMMGMMQSMMDMERGMPGGSPLPVPAPAQVPRH